MTRKLWDYLIGKGINLNHISNHGSILHYPFFDKKKINYLFENWDDVNTNHQANGREKKKIKN